MIIGGFGSVLKKESELEGEQFFVYLAEGIAGSYLAKIISLAETHFLENALGNPKYKKLSLKGFDYQILQTNQFLGRVAVYGRPAEPISDFRGTNILIDESDLQKLKQGIIDSPHTTGELKEEIRKLQ